MIIKKLTIKDFRNFDEVEILPSEQVNVIFGDNAEGKTNLLEAIWLFCGAKSFRGAKDKEMVGFEKEKAVNSCEYIFGGIERNARIIIDEKRNADIGGKKLPSAGNLAGKFYALVFSPLDLNLVNGTPSVRRKFLDTAIGQIYPAYNEKLRDYVKAVKQRNFILKDLKYHTDIEPIIDGFENSLSINAAEIVKYRRKYIEILKKSAPEIYYGISGGREKLEIKYESEISEKTTVEEIKKMYENSRKEDIITKVTSVGPHRDDVLLELNEKPIKSFGSQGQRRSVALALKLSEAGVVKKITGEYPVALLDDVMSELDTSRQDYILNHIKDWQVFITCCDPANILRAKGAKIFNIKNGEVRQ